MGGVNQECQKQLTCICNFKGYTGRSAKNKERKTHLEQTAEKQEQGRHATLQCRWL